MRVDFTPTGHDFKHLVSCHHSVALPLVVTARFLYHGIKH